MADLASILAGQQMTVNAPQLSAANAPFVWAQGGRRVTPDEIARQRLIAEEQTAGDYSPVGHWTQGLGRVLDGLEGGFAKRNLRRAEEANAAESDAVLQALLSGERDEASLLRAAANQYITPEARAIASSLMPKAWQPTNDLEKAAIEAGISRGSPQWVEIMNTAVQNKVDPWTNIVTGGESLMGRQSLIQQALGGGDPASSGGGVDWLSQFTPDEIGVFQRESQRRAAASNIPSGSPLQGGPTPGSVVDGYRFKGGNPNDPNAWEEVR